MSSKKPTFNTSQVHNRNNGDNDNNNRDPSSIAKARWKLLSSIFISNNNNSNNTFDDKISLSSLQLTKFQISKRSHQGFNLFPKQKKIDKDDSQGIEEWFTYDLNDDVYLDIW